MKNCNNCGAQVEEEINFCAACGSSDFSAVASNNQQPLPKLDEEPQSFPPIYDSIQEPSSASASEEGHGNITAGVVGAFLFSLIGGLLYFVVYQIGIIAGICGLVIFVLANFGYGLFAKTKNKASMVALIVSIVATIVMIFLAEYFCLSFEIFQAYKEMDITIFDAIKATPEFLAEPEISSAVTEDLAFAYIFGFLASIGNIKSIIKARKAK